MIEVKNLSKSFGKLNVLNGVNIEIKEGERIAIVGPSGGGKSTFLRCLNFLEVPSSGEIYFCGELLKPKGKEINLHRQRMGMVFQHFNLFPHKTVMQNIMLAPVKIGLKNRRNSKKTYRQVKQEAKENAISLLKRIGLEDKANEYPSKLSGGQKQRIAIIRALAMNPKVMLFDEPTSALDPEMVGEVLSLIKDLANEGMTMLIVTHEMKFAMDVSTKVLFIADGNILEQSPPKEFFLNPQHPRLKDFLTTVKKN